MSPLFLVGCGLLAAAVLLGATGAPAGIWVVAGAAGIALFWRGATTTPRRRIRSHRGSGPRGGRSRAAGRAKGSRSTGAGRGVDEQGRPVPTPRGKGSRGRSRPGRRPR